MAVTIREYYPKRTKKKTYGYEIEVTVDGKRYFDSKKGFPTRTEAKEVGKAKELELKNKVKTGHDIEQLINKEKSKLKLSELFDLWLNAKKSSISPKTYIFYSDYCKMILKAFGDPLITKIKSEKIELMINQLHDKSISSSTIRHYYNILNIVFNWAIDRNYLAVNPCKKVDKPKKSNKTMMVYDEEQLKKLLDRIKGMTCYVPVMLAATTGMRLGEICGLRWGNINLDNGYLEVKEQLQEVNSELELLPLKTASSKRKIILLDYTITALRELKETQNNNKDYLKDSYNKLDFVVCMNDGKPYNPSYVGGNYRRLLSGSTKKTKRKDGSIKVTKIKSISEELNIPVIRFHDLRHTHATLMLKANIHPKIVSERLGHSDIKMTLGTYSHVLPDMQEQAIKDLNSKLKL